VTDYDQSGDSKMLLKLVLNSLGHVRKDRRTRTPGPPPFRQGLPEDQNHRNSGGVHDRLARIVLYTLPYSKVTGSK
jgi:hypothetical protein